MSSALTGDAGVALVQYMAGTRLGWAFRSLPTLDFGVDAEAERIELDRPTGELVGLQIKSGPSHFREPNSGGWIYRPSQRHVDYWTKHSLPIFVILVDLKRNVAYWQAVNADTLHQVGAKTWKMLVPQSQTLDDVTGPIWRDIAQARDRESEQSFDANIERLPPSLRSALTQMAVGTPVAAGRLAHQLVSDEPRVVALDLLECPPSWFLDQAPNTWKILASYCSNHEILGLAAAALERNSAAQPSGDAASLATAALYLSSTNRNRSGELLSAARSLSGDLPLIDIVASLIANPTGTLPQLAHEPAASSEASMRAAYSAYQREKAAREDSISDAIRHGDAAIRLAPDNSGYLLMQVHLYLRRSTGPEAGTDDLGVAVRLCADIIADRTLWNGPLLDPCRLMVQAHLLRRDIASVRLWATPQPFGNLPAPLQDDHAIREGLFKAHLIGGELAKARQVQGETADEMTRLKMAVELAAMSSSREEQIAAWRDLADRASKTNEWNRLAGAVFRLATFGIASPSELEKLHANSHITAMQQSVIQAIAAVNSGVAGAEARLRHLADRDLTAAEALVEFLASQRRIKEAVSAAERGARQLRSPHLLLNVLDVLQLNGDQQGAIDVSRRIAMDNRVTGAARSQALRVLAMDASVAGDWSTAEAFCSDALDAEAPIVNVAWAWRLIICQLNQQAVQRAVEAWSRWRPEVRDAEEARLWLHVHSSMDWDEADIVEALSIEERFPGDASLAASLLTGALLADARLADPKADEDAPSPPYARQLQAQFQRHLAEHGDAGGITQLTGTPEQLIDQLTAMAMARSRSIADMQRQVVNGPMPFGLLATALNRPYGLSLAISAAPLSIGTLDEGAFDREVLAAERAVEQGAVLGLDALYVLSCLEDSSAVLSNLGFLKLTSSARADLQSSIIEARNMTPGESLVWSEEHQELFRVTSDEGQAASARLLLRKMETLASGLDAYEVQSSTLFGERDWTRMRSWMSAIQASHELNYPLWVDDASLRQLATSLGVQAFGTLALLEFLNASGIAFDSAAIVKELSKRGLIDLPITALLWIEIAEEDDLRPARAAQMLTRPSFWMWVPTALADVEEVIARSERRHPGVSSQWRQAAMIGAANLHPEGAARTLMGLSQFGSESPVTLLTLPDVIAAGLMDARKVATYLELGDPLEHLAEYLAEYLAEELGEALNTAERRKVFDSVMARLERRNEGDSGSTDGQDET